MRYLWLVGVVGLGHGACAAQPPSSVETIGRTLTPPTEPRTLSPKDAEPEASIPDDIVEKSALPVHGRRAADGEQLSSQDLFSELTQADVICVGEQHDNPHHHWAELLVVQELARRASMTGRELALGLEMFASDKQHLLTRFQRGQMSGEELLEAVDYEETWGYPFAYYLPQLEHAKARGFDLLALNAPQELTQKVARHGVESLSEPETRALPELDLEDPDHKAAFEAAIREHPSTGVSKERMYKVQVLWDETMAQVSSEWLKERQPARQLVVFAGMMHCRHSGIPRRIARRVPVQTASVKPVVVTDAGQIPKLDGFDYGLVMVAKDNPHTHSDPHVR